MNRRSGQVRLRSTQIRPPRRTANRWTTLGALTPSSSDQNWTTFEEDLKQLEVAVQTLRQRFDQVQTSQQQQQQLEQQLQNPDLSAAALKQLKQQLDELEVKLESALFDWRSLLEPFWQAVRFGGLGIILGWILRGIASR